MREEIEFHLADFSLDDRVAYIRTSGDVRVLASRIEATEGVSGVIAPASSDVLTLLNGLNVSDNDRVPATLAVMGLTAAIILGAYQLATGMLARRSELAVLRALGMSGTGIRSSYFGQGITTMAMVALIAVPLGLVGGQWAWTQYARDLEVVEEPVVPTSVLAIGGLVALAECVIVATTAGWLIIRRPAAGQLRVE